MVRDLRGGGGDSSVFEDRVPSEQSQPPAQMRAEHNPRFGPGNLPR
jgi:hypothetical protein